MEINHFTNEELNIYATGFVGTGRESVDHISYSEFVEDIKARKWNKYYKKYKRIVFRCRSFHRFPKRFFGLLTCWLFAGNTCMIVCEDGEGKKVTVPYLFAAFKEFVSDHLTYKRFLKSCDRHLDSLEEADYKPIIDQCGCPYYIRNDYVIGFLAGGSIGHIAGISENIKDYYGDICFVTSDRFPVIREDMAQNIIDDGDDLKYSNIRDVPSIYYNLPTYRYLQEMCKNKRPSFIYHRSALNEYSAVEFAIRHNVPYILEYNGSEVWIRKNWSAGKMGTEAISERIEHLAFAKASLIVCVSRPLKDQLCGMGVDASKVIVVPNGVNPEMYHPAVDRTPVRTKYNIPDESVVVGFIGTFGAWHGADVLARAAVMSIKESEYKTDHDLRYMFIGDGMTLPKVKQIISEGNAEEKCIFTGIVPQSEGMNYMAACDILVSPTVPNSDGTPFFGSPTKLFEYMAMGKAIVVSNMDQMAEVCEHERTALMPKPGDAKELLNVIHRLAEDSELRSLLGKNAREEVCRNYTWKIQTEKILREFEIRCGTV